MATPEATDSSGKVSALFRRRPHYQERPAYTRSSTYPDSINFTSRYQSASGTYEIHRESPTCHAQYDSRQRSSSVIASLFQDEQYSLAAAAQPDTQFDCDTFHHKGSVLAVEKCPSAQRRTVLITPNRDGGRPHVMCVFFSFRRYQLFTELWDLWTLSAPGEHQFARGESDRKAYAQRIKNWFADTTNALVPKYIVLFW